ncbi:hypothetical protein N0V93_008337 [Gnomoniopsis smithogilvyi]|uniref:Uncharacterized protein n=1 Tax=Gnomoniopsis smithogilvyi TaxID=1191159 RepID=A0A9W9CUN6_9PEZI|nr:hypothetical protein N0V93_008337 [Gnomoniopsis smithogilvyi]
MEMSSSSSRLPTLRELDDRLNISGLRKNDEDVARKNREEASKDLELQERVDRVRERLRAVIEVKKAADERDAATNDVEVHALEEE